MGLWAMTCAANIPPVPAPRDTTMVETPRPYWYLLPEVQHTLATKYAFTQRDSLSLEYIACLGYVASDRPSGGRDYFVHSVRFPEQLAWITRDSMGQIEAYRVAASCDWDELHLHTHSVHQCVSFRSPAQCTDSKAWREPSPLDIKNSRTTPLSFIQYGERNLLAYTPDSVPAWTLRAAPTRKRR
jgi:predicted NAD/FAD-dependent oxidoreductase